MTIPNTGSLDLGTYRVIQGLYLVHLCGSWLSMWVMVFHIIGRHWSAPGLKFSGTEGEVSVWPIDVFCRLKLKRKRCPKWRCKASYLYVRKWGSLPKCITCGNCQSWCYRYVNKNHACGIHFIKFWFEMNFSRLNNTWKIHVSTLCMWKNPWTFRSKTCFQSVHLHTVDGRNPKQPPRMYQILQRKLNNGAKLPYQLVSRISEPSTVCLMYIFSTSFSREGSSTKKTHLRVSPRSRTSKWAVLIRALRHPCGAWLWYVREFAWSMVILIISRLVYCRNWWVFGPCKSAFVAVIISC